jgi:hypothetical protein
MYRPCTFDIWVTLSAVVFDVWLQNRQMVGSKLSLELDTAEETLSGVVARVAVLLVGRLRLLSLRVDLDLEPEPTGLAVKVVMMLVLLAVAPLVPSGGMNYSRIAWNGSDGKVAL